jgi:hypothetical protein
VGDDGAKVTATFGPIGGFVVNTEQSLLAEIEKLKLNRQGADSVIRQAIEVRIAELEKLLDALKPRRNKT